MHLIYVIKYGKIPKISPGLIFVQKAVYWAYFSGSLFSEGLVIGRNFAFQNGVGLSIKTAKNTKMNSLKQLTVTVHGLTFRRDYYRKCNLRPRFGGLLLGRLIFGGAYYRNFTVVSGCQIPVL